MNEFVKRISKKIDKLPRVKLEEVLCDTIEENETLYSIIDSLSTGLIIINNDFVITQNNKIVESRLNYKIHLEDAISSNSLIWDIIDDSEIATFLRNCYTNEITNATEEFSTMTSGGSVRFITLTVNPLIIKNNLSGRIILVRDITDSKNQQIRLHRMENLANLTNLAAGMAHEIKNPLGAISIHIQLLQKAVTKARENENILPPAKFVEDHIDVVNEEIEHLNKLVMDFLLAVRPIKATLELKNPDSIIENTVSFFEAEFNRFNTKVKFEKNTENIRIMLDEKLFRDVILNFSQNSLFAIKSKFPECNNEITYNNETEFIGYFEIRTSIKENKYQIQIIDNGCGMNDETISKIFEPYFTTKATGTGLGMTMVYKIIKEFSGEIQVESDLGKGTCFTIIMPIPQKNKKLLNS